MSNDTQIQRTQPAPPAVQYRGIVERLSMDYLGQRMGTEDGRRQGARFALAFATAARSSKDPDAFYRCKPESIAAAVSLSMETGLMPGGAMPAVWLIPRAGELQWMPSHRGLIQLAQAAGYQVRAVPVCHGDTIRIEGGEVVELVTDPDAWPTSLADLRGVAVYVSRISDGTRFAAAWVPGAAIVQRSKAKGSGPVWREWPIEMAIKSAIRFVFARGYVPVESVELDTAMRADMEPDAAPAVQVQPQRIPSAQPPADLRTTPEAEVDRAQLVAEIADLAATLPPEMAAALVERLGSPDAEAPTPALMALHAALLAEVG